MNAKEAREKAKNAMADSTNSQYGEIMGTIRKAALKGKYTVSYGKSISELVLRKLKADGYKVTCSSYRNEINNNIEW